MQKQIEARIALDRQKQAIDDFGAKLVQQTAIANKDVFIDYCVEEIYRISNR